MNPPAPATQQIPLAMSTGMKLIYAITCAVGLLFALGSLSLFYSEEPGLEEILIGVMGLLFFGGGSLFILSLMKKKAGYLEIREDGILIDCYITIGFIPWTNLVKAGSLKALGAGYLGFKIKSVEQYLQSKNTLTGVTRSRDQSRAQSLMRVMMMVENIVPGKLLDLVFLLAGLSGMPKSSDEKDLMEWYDKNYGYNLLIQAFWFHNLEETLRTINQGLETQKSASPEPAPALDPSLPPPMTGTEIPEGYKKCPLCAEFVRLDAKICRFCRYEFDQ